MDIKVNETNLGASNDDNHIVVEEKLKEPLIKTQSLRTTSWRWLALVFACFIQIGSYISFDFPAYLEQDIKTDIIKNGNESLKFNLLYSVYSFPNIILPLIGGILIDKIGIRPGVFVFSLILVVGQGLCMFSTISGSYGLMVAGRFIFGLGGENLGVTQSTIVSRWFIGKELSFAMGTNITVSRLGSVIGSLISPSLYAVKDSLFLPLFVCFLVCVLSWVSGLALNVMDKKADIQEGIEGPQTLDPADQVKLSDIKELKLNFWLITTSCVLCYVCMFPFMSNLQQFFIYEYGFSDSNTGPMFSVPYLMAAFSTPLWGIAADKFGRRGEMLILSSIFLVIGHTLFLTLPQCPMPIPDPTPLVNTACSVNKYGTVLPGLIFLGLFYSLYAAVLWPCIPLVVPSKMVGSAFGIVNSVQNLGLTIAPLIVGALQKTDYHHGYFAMSLFFVLLALTCLGINIWIDVNDKKTSKVLYKTSGKSSAKASMRASFHN